MPKTNSFFHLEVGSGIVVPFYLGVGIQYVKRIDDYNRNNSVFQSHHVTSQSNIGTERIPEMGIKTEYAIHKDSEA